MGLFSKPKPKLDTSGYDKQILSNYLTIYSDAMSKQRVSKKDQIKMLQAFLNAHKIQSGDNVSPISFDYIVSLGKCQVVDTQDL